MTVFVLSLRVSVYRNTTGFTTLAFLASSPHVIISPSFFISSSLSSPSSQEPLGPDGRRGFRLRRDTDALDGGVPVGYVVGARGDVAPADEAVLVDGEGAGGLPARAALGRAVPDVLRLAELEGVVEGDGGEHVPGRGHAEPEERVQVALLVDHHAHVPVAAHADDPALRGLRRRVRDRDEVDVFVVG